MLRQRREVRQRIQMIVDAGLFMLSFYLAHAVRTRWQFEIFGGRARFMNGRSTSGCCC
ncbi:MAG: hypothetical protein M5U12_02300 [Verrucomicrobia bacterium]|nr:hypothetical protein [Verrucomicrobiota bacterium]